MTRPAYLDGLAGEPFNSERARIAALTRWAHEDDPTTATARARDGFLRRFERIVDPDGRLTSAEREIRARRLMRAHMLRLSRKARAKRAAARARTTT